MASTLYDYQTEALAEFLEAVATLLRKVDSKVKVRSTNRTSPSRSRSPCWITLGSNFEVHVLVEGDNATVSVTSVGTPALRQKVPCRRLTPELVASLATKMVSLDKQSKS